MSDCPYCKNCPYCGKQKSDPWREAQCVLNKPLMMAIPPEGVHLSCPVHPDGHHVFGSASISFSSPASSGLNYDHDPSKDLTYDGVRPFETPTFPTTHLVHTQRWK